MNWTATLTQLVIFGLANGAIIGLNALSVSLVYSVVRMINFAHGNLFALLTLLVVLGINQFGLNDRQSWLSLAGSLLWVLAVAAGFGLAANLAVERIGFRPFQGRSRLAPLMATLGISFMLIEAVPLAIKTVQALIPQRTPPSDMSFRRIPGLIPSDNLLEQWGVTSAVVLERKDVLALALALAVAGLVWLGLNRTRAGLMLRASASDAGMAQLCGVSERRALRLVFGLGGALAGVAAWMHVLYHTAPVSNFGAQSGLIAFTAAMIGGIGNPLGALRGGLFLGLLGVLSDYFLAAHWTPAVMAVALIAVLLLRQPDALAPAAAIFGSARRRLGRRHYAGLALLTGVAALLPWINQLAGLRLIFTGTYILVLVLLVLGLNVTVGWGGLLDLGFAGCFALGAYMVGILGVSATSQGRAWLPPAATGLALLAAGAVGAASGWAVGLLARRLSNEYMALATFAFGVIAARLLTNLSSITRGGNGMSGVPPLRFGALALERPEAKYYAALCLLLLAIAGVRNLLRSRFGRALAAISMDEEAAASSGIPTGRIKQQAWVLAGGLAGIAGGLFASTYGYLNPGLADFRTSVMVLIMVVIGGTRRLIAPLIGAMCIAAYDLVLIPGLGAWAEQRIPPGLAGVWAAVDPRVHNFLVFGVLLYLSVWYRTRRAAE